MSEELTKVYEPKDVEERWMKRWMEQKHYQAEATSDRNYFSIVIPPPNVTGVLHMGHALNNTLQDILCRYKRMKGFNVLWMPGTDHAGIATQNVVEKKLAAEGTDRHALGREKFVEEVWRWKEKHGSHIIHQLQRLGASCDWSRERFTMDDGLSSAVLQTFVSLYEKGLIYRDLYLINWCPRCHTALSDLEVEHEQQKGHLWYLRYPLKASDRPLPDPLLTKERVDAQGRPGEVVVATTRPETMLGDTAVAVHPEDERYRDLIGQTVMLPFVAREIPIIADHRVDREFGTGAVKITPAHDFNDFQLGNEHGLTRINIFTPEGLMNENAAHFQGLDRFECRRRIVNEMEEQGILLEIEDHLMNVGHCYRCKTVVEPYLSKQWFVKTEPLAKEALGAVLTGRTKFHPDNWTKTYVQWMENIQPWCISRQIWWGHRIPAWYCKKASTSGFPSPSTGEGQGEGDPGATLPPTPSHQGRGDNECPPIVSKEAPAQCPHCGGKDLVQDPDVLDTWFSSALWPFSTLGWPEKTPELKTFYPTSVLVTAFDIIFFWVARMMMMGLELMGDVPFYDVYIHAIVRDAEGKKMSKSKGNVIDPLEIMDKFGTDAFRFTLAALATQGRDIKLSEDIIQGYRNFCNKIWNASRFVLMHLKDYEHVSEQPSYTSFDQWIFCKLEETIHVSEKAIDDYKFDVAAKAIYQFFWHDFCDWYLEFIKGGPNKWALYTVLEISLKLLHPFMPFITEEIWHRLTGNPIAETIETLNSFPIVDKLIPKDGRKTFEEENRILDQIIDVVEAVRSIRGENRIEPGAQISCEILSLDPVFREAFIEHYTDEVERMVRAKAITLLNDVPSLKGRARAVISSDLQVFIPLIGLIDFEAERQRLEKEIGKLQKDHERIAGKLANKNFVDRAPEEIVAAEKEKLADIETKIERMKEARENLTE